MGEVTCYIQYSPHAREKQRLLECQKGPRYQYRAEVAGSNSDSRGGGTERDTPRGIKLWALLVATGCRLSAFDSDGDYASAGAPRSKSGAGAHRSRDRYGGNDLVARDADQAPARSQRLAEDAAVFSGGVVVGEYSGFRLLVLAVGCGGSERARYAEVPHRWRVPVSADDAGRLRYELAAGICRLFVSGVQYQHGLLADGRSGVVAVGEADDDGAGVHLADDGGVDCGAGGECFVAK